MFVAALWLPPEEVGLVIIVQEGGRFLEHRRLRILNVSAHIAEERSKQDKDANGVDDNGHARKPLCDLMLCGVALD